jgi:hypothetical protein
VLPGLVPDEGPHPGWLEEAVKTEAVKTEAVKTEAVKTEAAALSEQELELIKEWGVIAIRTIPTHFADEGDPRLRPWRRTRSTGARDYSTLRGGSTSSPLSAGDDVYLFSALETSAQEDRRPGMKASTAILIAVLVLIAVLAIYFVAKDTGRRGRAASTEERPGANPWEIYEQTNGTFDGAAQRALHEVAERPEAAATPDDHLLAATILTRNVIGQEHRPQTDRAGRPTRAAHEQTRRRRAAYDQARAHYMEALARLDNPVIERRGGHGARGHGATHAAPGRIVDEALEFAFGGFGTLIGNDPLVAALFGLGGDGVPPVAEGGNGFFTIDLLGPMNLTMFEGVDGFFAVDTPLAEAAFRRQEDIVRERQVAASTAAAAAGGGLAAEVFLDLSLQNTSDSQNVHDPGVLACNKAIVQRLRDDQGPLGGLPTLDSIMEDTRKNGPLYSEGRPNLVSDALGIIQEARKGERVVSYDCSDEESLRRVWARADDPRNAAVRGKMRQALFDALVSSQKSSPQARTPECVYGRVEPQLGSLTLLDWDKRNWVVKKVEQFKNEIFVIAGKVIKGVAQRASESDAEGMKSAGRHFLTTSFSEQQKIVVPEEAAKQLRDDMRREVSAAIDKYLEKLEVENGVRGGIPDHMVDKVKEEALAAIMD